MEGDSGGPIAALGSWGSKCWPFASHRLPTMRGCRAVTSLLLTIANDATAWSHPALARHRTAALPRHRTAALHRHRMVATADVPAAPLQWSEEADLTWTFDGSNSVSYTHLTLPTKA